MGQNSTLGQSEIHRSGSVLTQGLQASSLILLLIACPMTRYSHQDPQKHTDTQVLLILSESWMPEYFMGLGLRAVCRSAQILHQYW